MHPGRCLAAPGARIVALFVFLCVFGSFTAPSSAQTGLQFNGSTQRVTFGSAGGLNVSSFTVECWFKRLGTGAATSTGTGGWASIVPLVTKGRGEAETPANLNMNWFLGLRSDSVLAADFEEASGPNHPIGGTRVVPANIWHHAAVTYDVASGRYRLYLNGAIEKDTTLAPGLAPAATSIQHAGIATAMTSTGAAAGFFNGIVDEVRVWNVERTPAEIAAGIAAELASGAGLAGRWGLNDGGGLTAANSVAGGAAGTLVNAPAWVAGSPFANAYALRFLGTSGVAALGNPPELGLPEFTIECWFRRDGAGVGTSTGSGGGVVIPLFAHGRADSDEGDVHVNWLLGIRASDGVLMADFEESSAGTTPSLNHPVYGVTPVAAGSGWHHGAATYDGTTWRLYLDGTLEAVLAVGEPAGTPTVMPVSFGSALTTAGVADGFLDGAIDEARIWNFARTEAAIQADINATFASAAGLVGRWGMNEGAGAVIVSSAGASLPGTLSAAGWRWTEGAPFDRVVVPPSPPAAPSDLVATAPTATLVHLTWTDASTNETGFEIERSTSGAAGPFLPRATVGAGVTSWDDSPLAASSEYCYRLRAVNVHGASAWTAARCATTPAVTRTALDLSGGAHVGFGDADALDLPVFTIECWFRRDGAGTTTSSGTGGITDAIPLVTNGRGEGEASNIDLNWFLGLRAADGVLAADFEEGAGGASPSLNHPVFGVTPIPANGAWHHAAATYDGTTWNLYLDGNLEATLAVGQPVASASTQHVAIGSALTSAGAAAGAFDGAFDEVRVWNAARTLTEIRGTANGEIDAATPGLVARWGLDEGTGTAVNGGAGTAVNGGITGAGYAWIAPAPFDLAFNDPPAPPVLVGPANGAAGVPIATPLQVSVSDPDGDPLTVRFYGRSTGGTPPGDFTIMPIPDTQYYTSQLNGGSSAMLKSQMDWIVAHRVARSIAYVVELGDCVENGDNGGNPIEWMRADTAWARIEDPLTTGLADGIPFGICVGNHDQSPNGSAAGTTTFYNQYFGTSRFQGRAYYGGHYGANNDNWFDLFSVEGYDFICIGLEYDTAPDVPVLDWADSLLKAHPNRRGILASHAFLNTGNPGSWQAQGQATYEALKDNPNLDFMLCGHVPGEGRRVETFNGHTTHILLSDYQGRTNGGSGWMRIMEFSPANDVVRVRTYSPWLDQWEADADSSSQFTLGYDLGGSGPFTLLGSAEVASGATAGLAWPQLAGETEYEWYVTVDDGSVTRTGPAWSFTTAEAVAPMVELLSPAGGEYVGLGQNLAIAWTATDNIGVASIDLQLSRSGPSGPWETIAEAIANSGAAVWPAAGATTADAYVRVIARDAAGNIGQDVGDAAFSIVTTTSVGENDVKALALGPVVPNPARGVAKVELALPWAAEVRLTVYDLQGREVARLARGRLPAGRHTLAWNPAPGTVRDGVYFVRLETPGRTAIVRRAVLMR